MTCIYCEAIFIIAYQQASGASGIKTQNAHSRTSNSMHLIEIIPSSNCIIYLFIFIFHTSMLKTCVVREFCIYKSVPSLLFIALQLQQKLKKKRKEIFVIKISK